MKVADLLTTELDHPKSDGSRPCAHLTFSVPQFNQVLFFFSLRCPLPFVHWHIARVRLSSGSSFSTYTENA